MKKRKRFVGRLPPSVLANPSFVSVILVTMVYLSSCAPAASPKTMHPTRQVANINQSRTRIPGSIEECFAELKKSLPKEEIERFQIGDEHTVVAEAHFGLGRWIRNEWGLWSESKLTKFFSQMGIDHPDDMSAIILMSFHRHLNGREINLAEQVKYHQEHWKSRESSREASYGNHPPCSKCHSAKNTIPILYGDPAPGLVRKAKNGDVMLGGCFLTGHDPHWFCKKCKHKW